MNAQIENLKTFVKDKVAEVKDHMASLPEEGKKVMDSVKNKVKEKQSEGMKKLEELANQVSVKEIMDKFGTLKVAELVEKAKTSELFKHGEILKKEAILKLGLASADEIAGLNASVTAIKKDVAEFKKMKEEIKDIKADLKELKKKSAPPKEA